MQWQLVFFGMFPIFGYVLILGMSTQRKALVGAILVAAATLIYNSIHFRQLEIFSLISFLLFLVLGAVSLKKQKDVYFKFQPVLLEVILAGIFLYFNFVVQKPLFFIILDKYMVIGEIIPAYFKGYYEIYALTMSKSIAFLLLFHAVLTAWAALRLSTGWWFAVRVFGFYLCVGILFLAETFLPLPYVSS